MMNKNSPRIPLFTEKKEVDLFISLFGDLDEEIYIEVAKLIFIDGLTNEEVAEKIGYSKRHIERLRSKLIKVALKRAVKELVRMGVIPNDR